MGLARQTKVDILHPWESLSLTEKVNVLAWGQEKFLSRLNYFSCYFFFFFYINSAREERPGASELLETDDFVKVPLWLTE